MSELREEIIGRLKSVSNFTLTAERSNEWGQMEFVLNKNTGVILDAVKQALPGEKEAIEVASDEDERRGFMTAKFAYLQAVEDIAAILEAAKSTSNHKEGHHAE